MALVQQINFMLGLNQVINLMQQPEMNAVKLRLGVEEVGRIVLKAYGVKWDGSTAEVITDEDGEYACPVPPDCVDPLGNSMLNEVLDNNITAGSAINFK